jgi:cell division protein ZapA (FtsZ GTPase activity inhibitor)
MAKNKMTRVVLKVLGREYPVKCTEDEGRQLEAVQHALNQQLNNYKIKYAQLDNQDCLSMALIENELRLIQLSEEKDETQVLAKIDQITSRLEASLR